MQTFEKHSQKKIIFSFLDLTLLRALKLENFFILIRMPPSKNDSTKILNFDLEFFYSYFLTKD